MTRAPLILAGVAALMGAAGVALAAAGVHENGGELAERAALFLLLHAAAALGIAAHARIATASARALLIVGFVMEPALFCSPPNSRCMSSPASAFSPSPHRSAARR